MRFTSLAVLALFLADTSAVKLNKDAKLKDDCGGKWCNKGLPYDLDVKPLEDAKAENAAAKQVLEAAKKADASATEALEAAKAKAKDTANEAKTATEKKKAAREGLQGAALDAGSEEDAHNAAIKAKHEAMDERLKAKDAEVEADIIKQRKDRDLAAAKAAKAASDKKLQDNQERVDYEKDQLHKGENQDRLRQADEDDRKEKARIQGQSDERERANGRLVKALAS